MGWILGIHRWFFFKLVEGSDDGGGDGHGNALRLLVL